MKPYSYYNIREEIEMRIKKKGGWVNAHAHLDRAYTITKHSFPFTNATLQEKWKYVDEIKRSSTISDYYDRMAYALEQQIQEGVTTIGTFIDVDPVVKDKVMKASERIKQTFTKAITIQFINQALKGVLEKEARYWFLEAASYVDIIGGLPGKDAGREGEHLDILLQTAKRLKKRVHVHIDQLNTKKEKETALLIQKIKEHHMEGKVVGIHCIALGAHKKEYRQKMYKQMKDVNMMVVACPSAWIDARRTEELTPTHNSVTPVDELVPHGVGVALGTDNIGDVYKPFSDGVMWTELRFLLESCHYYNIDSLVDIATVHGRRALGVSL